MVLAGNPPGAGFEADRRIWTRNGDVLSTSQGVDDDVLADLEVRLPAGGDPVELWTLTLVNSGQSTRTFQVAPYLEWVLNRADADRNHTQYNRLFAEIEYVDALHAVLAWDKHAKALGFLAVDHKPEGFLSSRMDFIGRARRLADPRALETLHFMPAKDEASHPTLDPIASLLAGVMVPPNGEATIRFLIGLTTDKARAVVERRRLAFAGAAFVALALTDKGELADDPDLDLAGIPEKNAAGELLDDVVFDAVMSTIETLPRARRRDPDAVAESVRRAVRSTLAEHWGKKPLCFVHVLVV